MGITSLLLNDVRLPNDVNDSLNLISASSGLLLVLINNLLDVRKLNANMMKDFPLVPILPAGPMIDAADFCRPLAVVSGVNIRAVPGDAANTWVRSNYLRLQQVIINLISNAIKYTSTGSTIEIYSNIRSWEQIKIEMESSLATGGPIEPSTGHVVRNKFLTISVTDAGSGIIPDQAERLFGRFSMLSNSKLKRGPEFIGQPSGSGLGLNLCKSFVHLMGGNVWAANNSSGDGSTFSFYLPVIQHEDTEAVAEQKVAIHSALVVSTDTNQPSGEQRSSSFQYRVLLVDDTLINRKVFLRMLRQIGVSNSRAVESGACALAVLRDESYDLVISDVQMPGMNGMELSKAIQDYTDLVKKPVVIGLTADTSERVEVDCLAHGMRDVLHKPMTVNDMKVYFETKVRQWL